MRLFSLSVCLILVLTSFLGLSQTTYVPDDNFEAYLEANGMGNGIANDNYVTTANIAFQNVLDVSNQNISDLTGVEGFTGITTLRCTGNSLTSLDLSSNTLLRYLSCDNNDLTSLTISPAADIVSLHCGTNDLTTLDVTPFPNLNNLTCWYNSLTSLDLSAQSGLRILQCQGNNLTSLDLSNNTDLRTLRCDWNSLTTLDLTANTALQQIQCDNNNLTTLTLGSNSVVWTLDCSDNSLTSLDLSANTALTTLDCADNSLNALNLATNTALTSLYMGRNPLSTIDLSANTNLVTLNCYNGSLTSLNVSLNTALLDLDCRLNSLTMLNVKNGNNSAMTNFKAYWNNNLTCVTVDNIAYSNANWSSDIPPGCVFSTNCTPNLTYVPDDNFEGYLEANGMGNGVANDDYVYTANINGVTSLDVSNQSITNLTGIEGFTSLTVLDCSDNSLASVDVSMNSNLEELYCQENSLSILSVSTNLALTRLDCSYNLLSTLDVSANTLLDYLSCSYNSLTVLDVSANTALYSLTCNNNSLTALDISANTALTNLNCASNAISTLVVSSNTLLVDLFCSYNNLTALDVAANTQLARLSCANNSLTTLDVSTNSLLTMLICSDNSLTSLDVRNGNNTAIPTNGFWAFNNPNLTCIDVNSVGYCNTNWTNIDPASSFSTVCVNPFETHVPDDNFEAYLEANGMGNGISNDNYVTTANISGVTHLNVSSQGIADLTGIEAFTALTDLRCVNNNLTAINVSANTALNFLDCTLNSLTVLDVSANTALAQLSCSANNLTALDVSANTSLVSLACYGNSLTALDVSANTALLQLSCSDNSLTAIDVSANTALTQLYIGDNSLTTLDVSANTILDRMYCYRNNLTTLDVSANTALTILLCYGNSFTSLDVSANTALTRFYCNDNSLIALNVKNGNNTALTTTTFRAYDNPNLTCIQVDDVAYSTANWTQIDAASSFSVNCPPPQVTPTWTGTTNTDWFTASNWSPSGVPMSTDDVVIPDVSGASGNSPQIVGPSVAEVNGLTIDAGATLEVSNLNGGTLDIHGDISNNGTITGTGTISIEGGATQSIIGSMSFGGIVNVPTGATLSTGGNFTLTSGGSLLHGLGTPGGGGDVTGNVSVQRQGSTFGSAYNFWSSPVQGQNVSALGSAHYYNPASASDLGAGLQDGWLTGSGAMTPGLGYAAQGAGLVTFTGTAGNAPTGSDITVTIDKPLTTVSNERNPWNLIGNPFPSALDANLFQAENGPAGTGLITGTLYFWDDDNSGGSGYTVDDFAMWNILGVNPRFDPSNQGSTFNGYIASGQSFFVEKVNNGTSQVRFKNSMRSSSDNSSFFRQSAYERVYVGVFNPDNVYGEAQIAFLPDATDSLDLAYDAKKFKGNPDLAFGTKLGNDFFSIQAWPTLTTDKTIPLALDAGVSGDYTLQLMAVEELDESVVVTLEDALLGTYQNLRIDPEYSFTTLAGLDIERFYLHFNAELGITSEPAGCLGGDGQIVIEQSGAKTWDYILVDEQGNERATQFGFTGTNTIGGLDEGNYSLVFADNSGYQFTKFVTVTSIDRVTAAFETDVTVTYVGMPVNFIDRSVGATTYNWDFGDGTVGSTSSPVHTYLEAGSYTVSLWAANNDCQDQAQTVIDVSKLATGFPFESAEQLKIFASTQTIFVDFLINRNGPAEILIYDALGRQIYDKNVPASGRQSISISHPDGVYIVKVNLAGELFTHRVVMVR